MPAPQSDALRSADEPLSRSLDASQLAALVLGPGVGKSELSPLGAFLGWFGACES